MKVTQQDLRERYETLETQQLLELHAQGALTETATRVLEQVLAERSVSAEERVAVASEVNKRAAARDAMMAALASRGARLGAQLIDVFVTQIILFLSVVLWGAVAHPLGILGFIVAAAYLLLADGLPRGQSVGKRVLGIAVVDRRTHKPCTYGESFIRNILMLLGIIDWAFIFGRTRQRLGDMAASTVVVRVDRREVAGVEW